MPDLPHIMLQNISCDPEGDLHIAYYMPERDVKAVGVAHLHTLLVPAGFDYDDEIEAVLDAVRYLIRDVLDDFDKLAPGARAVEE